MSSPRLPILPLLLLVLTGGCSDEPQSAGESPAAVRIAAAQAPAGTTLSYPGHIRSVTRSRVAPQASGVVAQLHVTRGSRVQPRDVLATLTVPGLAERTAAARSQLSTLAAERDQAKQDLDRLNALVDRQLIARSERDRAESRWTAAQGRWGQAKGELAAAEAIQAQQRIRATHAGIVAQVHAEPGDFAPAGHPIITLVGEHAWEIEVAVPAGAARSLATGDVVQVSLPNSPNKTPGTLREHGQRASPGGLVALIFELVDPPEFATSGPAQVHLPVPNQSGVWLPLEAVRWRDQDREATVLTVLDGVAHEVAVEIGETSTVGVRVHGELEPGDLVIVAGPDTLRAGAVVAPVGNLP